MTYPRELPTGATYMMGALVGRFVPNAVLLLFGGAGITRPDVSRPHVLLLRPFRSVHRDLFSHFWVGPCMWQFGQCIYPVDRNTGAFTLREGYVIPNRPSWKRHAFGFDRVLHEHAWLSEVIDLSLTSRIIIADTTHLSKSVIAELRELATHDLCAKTIGVYDTRSQHLRAIPAGENSTAIQALVDSSIPYDYGSPASLEDFWQALSRRAALILRIPMETIPHPIPPPRFYLNKKHLVSMFSRGSLSYEPS